MNYQDWNNLRAKLNHGWLPKKYLNFLNAWAECLDDLIIERSSIPDDIVAQLEALNDLRDDFELFIESIEESLSPRQLVDEYPLNNMEESDKVWLKEVIHTVYCERTKIKITISDLHESFKSISDQHVLLMKALQGEYLEVVSQLGPSPFIDFRDQVTRFSKLISSLPYEIQVI